MVFKKCPGQDLSRKKIEDVVSDILCQRCGKAVEFFFDDFSRICPNCGAPVFKSEEERAKDFKCALWCEAAEDCLGPDLPWKLEKQRAGVYEKQKKK